MCLPRGHQQDGQDSGSQDRDLHRSVSDATQNQLRHKQLRSAGGDQTLARVPAISGLKPPVRTQFFRAYSGTVSQSRTYCTVTTVQCHPWSGKGVAG